MIETSLRQSEPVELPGRPFGQVARSVAGYAVLAALMIVALPVFLPAALLHCGIRNGRSASWAALAGAVALVALYLGVSAQSPGTTMMELRSALASAAGVILALGVPALLVLPLVERAESFGRVLALMILLSAAALGVAEVATRVAGFSLHAEASREWQVNAAHWVETYRQNKMPPDIIKFAQWVEARPYFVTSSVLVSFTLFFTLSLLMLGRLKAWRELVALRHEEKAGALLFRNLALPDWMLFAFIIGALTPLLQGLLQKFTANVLVVVAVLYLLQGLAIFRSLLVAMGAGLFGSLLAWMLLVLLTGGVGLALLSIAGLFDSFFHFRDIKKRKDDSHESHSD